MVTSFWEVRNVAASRSIGLEEYLEPCLSISALWDQQVVGLRVGLTTHHEMEKEGRGWRGGQQGTSGTGWCLSAAPATTHRNGTVSTGKGTGGGNVPAQWLLDEEE